MLTPPGTEPVRLCWAGGRPTPSRGAGGRQLPLCGRGTAWLRQGGAEALGQGALRASLRLGATGRPSGGGMKRERIHPLRSQRIAHRGPCGKAPVVPQNRRPRPEPTGRGVAQCACCRGRIGRAETSNLRGQVTVTPGGGRPAGRRRAQDCHGRRVSHRRGDGGRAAVARSADDVNPLRTSAFDLPDRLAVKADPGLIDGDERHFGAIAESLEQSIADLSDVSTPRARRPAAPARRPWTATRRSTD